MVDTLPVSFIFLSKSSTPPPAAAGAVGLVTTAGAAVGFAVRAILETVIVLLVLVERVVPAVVVAIGMDGLSLRVGRTIRVVAYKLRGVLVVVVVVVVVVVAVVLLVDCCVVLLGMRKMRAAWVGPKTRTSMRLLVHVLEIG